MLRAKLAHEEALTPAIQPSVALQTGHSSAAHTLEVQPDEPELVQVDEDTRTPSCTSLRRRCRRLLARRGTAGEGSGCSRGRSRQLPGRVCALGAI